MIYLTSFIGAIFLSLILTPLIKRLAIFSQAVDRPGPRKIHQRTTPLLGGLAVFLAFASMTVLFWYLGYIEDIKINGLYIAAILLGGLILMIGGFLDDRFRLPPWQQLIFPLIAIFLVLMAGIKVQYITNPGGGVLGLPNSLGIIFTFFWLLGMTYTTKFLDGLDGLAIGITSIGAFIIFIVSLYWDVTSSGTSVLALILAGAGLGFLVFNWHPAKIFLGEGGSVFCGFMLGVLSIISGSKIATALLIMGIPILDVLWVIFQRIWQGKSPVVGDNKHLHFRLLDLGLSQKQVVIFLYCITTAFGITSLFLHSKGKIIALGILLLFTIILGFTLIALYRLKDQKNGLVKK